MGFLKKTHAGQNSLLAVVDKIKATLSATESAYSIHWYMNPCEMSHLKQVRAAVFVTASHECVVNLCWCSEQIDATVEDLSASVKKKHISWEGKRIDKRLIFRENASRWT